MIRGREVVFKQASILEFLLLFVKQKSSRELSDRCVRPFLVDIQNIVVGVKDDKTVHRLESSLADFGAATGRHLSKFECPWQFLHCRSGELSSGFINEILSDDFLVERHSEARTVGYFNPAVDRLNGFVCEIVSNW